VSDASYLRFLRSLPCLACERPADDAHHVSIAEPGVRGFGMKRSKDRHAVPLCRECHHKLHNYGGPEVGFWIVAGVDPVEWAKESWGKWTQRILH
jgi:hypothetical protein